MTLSTKTATSRKPTARGPEPLKFAYWVPNVSGGLVISKIDQRTDWSLDYNVKLAQIAERSGFDYALSQIRFTAGYGADNQHESVAFSHALLAATERLKVIAALLPGPWNPALAAKLIATISQLTNARVAVNIVSGWFRGEFAAIGEPWLDHDERYRRSEEFIRALRGIWTEDNFTFRGDFYRFQRLHAEAEAARPPARDLPGRQLARRPRHGLARFRLVLHQRQHARGDQEAGRRHPGQGCRRTTTPSGSASTPSPSPARPRRRRRASSPRSSRRPIPRRSTPSPTRSRTPARPRPEGKGNWAKSSFEDLVQYNDGFRSNLIGTPEQIAERILALKDAGAEPDPSRLPALPGGGRVLRPARDPARPRARGGGGPERGRRGRVDRGGPHPSPGDGDSSCRSRTPARVALDPQFALVRAVPAPGAQAVERSRDADDQRPRGSPSTASRSPSAASRR